MAVFETVQIGDVAQKHGFQVAITTDCGFRLEVYCQTAEQARNVAFNVDRKYGSIKAMSVMGY